MPAATTSTGTERGTIGSATGARSRIASRAFARSRDSTAP